MTATNHALTGAVIGFSIDKPWLAMVLAFGSHFLLDVLPHYGSRLPDALYIRSSSFKRLLIADITACLLLVLLLAVTHPRHWLLAAFCAFLATLPDIENLPKFIDSAKDTKYQLRRSWTAKIQWFERPPGAVVEIAWALAAGAMVRIYL